MGVGGGVTVYVDGVRANEPDAHEVNFDLLPLEDVERVEVVYGPSVLLGRNALGAAVNLVTRRGSNPPSREVEASAGSYGRFELKAHAGARRGVGDYYLGARYEREDGWRDDTRSRIATLFGKVGLLNGTWDATLRYSGADNRIFQAGSLPESVAAASPQVNFTRGDYWSPRAHLVVLNAQRLVGQTQFAINAFGRSLNGEQFNVNFVGQDSRQLTRTRIGGTAAQLSGKLRAGARIPSPNRCARTRWTWARSWVRTWTSGARSPLPSQPATTGSGCRLRIWWIPAKAASTSTGGSPRGRGSPGRGAAATHCSPRCRAASARQRSSRSAVPTRRPPARCRSRSGRIRRSGRWWPRPTKWAGISAGRRERTSTRAPTCTAPKCETTSSSSPRPSPEATSRTSALRGAVG